MIGIGRYRMQRAFGPLGRLVSLGLIDLRSEPGRVVVLRSVIDCVGNGLTKSEKVRHFLLGDEVCPVRGWDDFAHLGGEVETVGRILSGALEQRQPGAHVLLYGPPGTGKTELAKVLAARIGAALFAVGEADRQGGEPSRGDRLGTWRLQQNLIPNDSRRLLLFDEMEDLFFGGGDPFSRLLAASGSKVFMHRLMETNPIPTIWTANSISAIEPAFLRRFTYALEVPIPGERVRGRMWSRELHAAGIEADDATAAGLAAEFPAAPGLLTGAVKAAALAGGGTEVVRLAVRGIAKAMKGGRAPAPFRQIEERYDPALVNASADLAALAERLARPGATRTFSLCLHGGPGTGKSEYVRWLARRLDLPLLAKRASDIISMWVGETERNIARAFEEARREQAFLQFDEADSFLSSRQGALHSWEISQVNEMLTWMESHELPFVCTTNLMQALDEASLRRFTFKVRFDPLTRQQRTLAFKKFFEFEPPRGLDSLDLLTPGDFAVVNRRATISGTLGDPRALLDMLAEEQTAKPQASRPIGFAAGP
jgi:SpoVK/Ycf46/Vps4 family AAA+-type ATPase